MRKPDISRFIHAQARTHEAAVRELRAGHKCSHWSWWEIPQIIGLGRTSTSMEYAVRDLEEARECLKNETLRTHLLEICEVLLSLESCDAEDVMGYPDDLKLRSCMTLFREADPECDQFQAVLDKYFGGRPDHRTLAILRRQQAEAK